ncbi:MAG TPA: metalloregulator ArsR/SmtB family transcription factor [Clostridia bacterium]|nr:metalloregulator ArsR/SmtB family transcription factor [Clostridia bacterium]
MKIEEIIAQYLPCDKELSDMTSFFSIFSDNTRLKIISLLSISEICVSDISRLLKLNQTTVSHQLAVLKKGNIVDCRRDGKTIYYFIVNDHVERIMEMGVRQSKSI